jgi:hypothetical protein
MGTLWLGMLAACSSGPNSTESDSSGESRLASSLSDLFRQSLSIEGLDTPTEAREAINRAIVSGKIDALDYEAEHDRYSQCMTDNGYPPSFRKTDVGIYVELPYVDVDDQNRLDEAHSTCTSQETILSQLYRIQQANPDLLSDSRQVVVNCLRNGGWVDDDYTAEQFGDNEAMNSFPFDVYDSGINDCLSSSGYLHFQLESASSGEGD